MKPSGWFWVQVVNLAGMAAFLAFSLWGVYMRPCPMGAGRAGSLAMLAFATAFAAFVMGTMVERELGGRRSGDVPEPAARGATAAGAGRRDEGAAGIDIKGGD